MLRRRGPRPALAPGEGVALSTSYLRLAVFALVATYTSGFLLWYSATALGLAPMLDGREQLELAIRLADGSLPPEPFYRAAMFPSLVAWLIRAGVSTAELPFAARMLNGGLHLLSTALVWMIAARVWNSRWSAALAALLFGMNPVVLHFAADPLDLSLAMAFMLGGVLAGMVACGEQRPSRAGLFAAGALLASAALTRPQMVLLLPVLLGYLALGRASRRYLLWALAPMLLVLGLMGAANFKHGGAWRVMPWQGAYNLWAANGPHANGRYFVQRERQTLYSEGGNPARVESERLYRREQPAAPDDYAHMTRYWQQRTFDYVRSEPVRWLRLVASKAWYLLNDFEQYDIKTYHFHKAQSPWLRVNPLGWSWLLALSSAALVMQWRRGKALWVVTYGVSYAAGLLLSYVSARFRLPLVPLLAIVAGGVLCSPTRQAVARGAFVALLVWALARQPLPPGEAERTVLQDHLLSARAAAVLGLSDEALLHAQAALARAPQDEAARELLCVVSFNAWLRAEDFQAPGPLADCERSAATSPSARRALGVLYWRAGRGDEARTLWRALVADGGEQHDAALAALVMVDDPTVAAMALNGRLSLRWSDELLLALALAGQPEAGALLAQRLPSGEIVRQTAALKRLFAPPSAK